MSSPYRVLGIVPHRKKPKPFPCKKCFELETCEKLCELVERDRKAITDHFDQQENCPDCGSEGFLEGPHGGLAVNFFCQGCGHGFNHMGPFGVDRINRILRVKKDLQ